MDKVKRERAVNFTELEVRFLIDIALRYSFIIENKKTDAVSCKDKNKAWENIATEFNAVTGCINRSAKVLRLKYDNIKRVIKQKQSKNKYEIFKTGGGAAIISPFTDYEEKLMSVILLSVDGLPSEDDSDHILAGVTLARMPETAITSDGINNDNGSCSHTDVLVDENLKNLVEYIEEKNGTLTMVKGKQLSCSVKQNNITVEGTSSKCNPKQVEGLVSTSKKYSRNDSSISNQNTDVLTDSRMQLLNLQSEIENKKEPQDLENGERVTVGSSSSKWKSWHPKQLKEKPHKSLSSTPKKVGPVTKGSLNHKFDGLADSRVLVINLQKQIAEKEIEHKKEQQGVLENEEYRRMEEHIQVMSNLNLQRQILLDMHERYKIESDLRQELLQLEIQNKALELVTKERQL